MFYRPNGKNSNNKITKTIVISVLFFIVLEGALQIRSQLRYGQSIFNLLSKKETYVFNNELKLKLLRPNARIEGSQSIIETNSLGLRSPEIDSEKKDNEIRIAIVGASSVMGTYTRNNQDTLSYLLEKNLQAIYSDYKISVINAGIAGYSISQQSEMLDRLIKPLSPNLVIWYPGFNDISGYCTPQKKQSAKPVSFPTLNLPKWLLTVDLLIKNTVWLRTTKFENEYNISASDVDITNYRESLNEFYSTIKANGVPLITVTMARAFKRDMAIAEQEELSETARFYNNCFDVVGLHDIYDQHNDLIAYQSQKQGFQNIRLDRLMPGGKKYFGDATHFSNFGTKFVVKIISKMIVSSNVLLPRAEVSEEKQR